MRVWALLLCITALKAGKTKVRNAPSASFVSNLRVASDTFVLFHKEGCGNCKAVMPKYEGLMLPPSADLILAKVEITRKDDLTRLASNDRPGEGTTSYPTLKRYAKNADVDAPLTATVECQLMGRELIRMSAAKIVEHMQNCAQPEEADSAEEQEDEQEAE